MSRRVQTREGATELGEEAPRDRRRFTLSVLGFPTMSVEEATERLADAFGLPLDRAVRYATEVPARVAEHLSVEQLDFHVLLLHELGAELRVLEEEGEGRWTVTAPRSRRAKIDPDVICRWRHAEPRGPVRRRPQREVPPPDSPPPSEPNVPVALASGETPLDDLFEADEHDVPDLDDRQVRELDESDVPGRDAAPDTPDFKVAVYAPPDLQKEHATWVDQLATSEFFIRGLAGRQKQGWGRKKVKAARKKTKRGKFRPHDDAEAKLRRRQVRAKVIIALCALIGGGMLLSALLPPGARELVHTSDAGRFVAELPPGFSQVQNRTGVYASPVGEMGYSAYSVRKRGDNLGALVFNVVDVPDRVRRQWSSPQVLEGALQASLSAQEGSLVQSRRINEHGRLGFEGDYRVTRFGQDYSGRIRVFDVDGDVALLLCEGIDTTCQSDGRARRFFDSFTVEPADE